MNTIINVVFILILASCSTPLPTKKQKYSAISFDPMQTESLERLAWDGKEQWGNYPKELVLCYKGKFDESFKLLKQQIDQENNPKYWNVVGSCYYWKKDFAKARFYYEMGLAIDSQNIDLLHNLAMVDWMQGREQLAVQGLMNITNKDNKNLLSKWNLSLIYYSMHRPELAVKQLSELTKVIPNDPLVGLMLMKSYCTQEKYSLVLESYARIPKEFQNQKEFLNYLAFAYLKIGDLEKARSALSFPGEFKEDKDKNFHQELMKYLETLQTQKRNMANSQGEKL